MEERGFNRMNSCQNCKYNTKQINDTYNWCHEPTFLTGVIVRTTTPCDKFERGPIVSIPSLPIRQLPPTPRKDKTYSKSLNTKTLKLDEEKIKKYLKKYFPEAVN